MGRKNGDVWTARDTFWNKLRVENGYRIKDIAELLDLGEKTTAAYFTGYTLPNDDIVKKFCDLFCIDFMKGRGEFHKAYSEYNKTHNRKCKVRKVSMNSVAEDTKEVEPPKAETPKKVDFSDTVLEMLYGKIPYVDFKILTGQLMSGADILECVYGKVDFETFANIVKTIKA